ncbi:hypothetical protein H0A43_07290 [Arcobacter lanthieri]|uniref:hypothetical protein n=1 Tax=Aliarcobacter lanthieri TaxID=1355374 RepID=UPI001923CD95|nr:hypothetical protein [Aliarcobacter lanthieri]MBL3520275.1 hypothetical protein [Aliarcobacter lanthieri]
MFLGVSKNIGGFRIGVGTRINQNPTGKELKNLEFKEFLSTMGNKAIASLKDFVNASGYDFDKLLKYEIDIDTLFVGNKKYDEFLSIAKNIEKVIKRITEIEDFGVVGKRKISDEIYKLEDFVTDYVQNYTQYLEDGLATKSIEIDFTTLKEIPKKEEIKEDDIYTQTIKKILDGFLFVGVIFLPLIFSWFTLMKRYSKYYRIFAFSWLVIYIFIVSNGADKNKEKDINNNQNIEKSNK